MDSFSNVLLIHFIKCSKNRLRLNSLLDAVLGAYINDYLEKFMEDWCEELWLLSDN